MPKPVGITKQAERVINALDGNPYPMAVLYRFHKSGPLLLEIIRAETPEEARLEASGWRVCGVYRKGVTIQQLQADLAECR